MRVIAGAAKGTRLASPPPGTRPVSDMAREGLFASLGARVDGARCLDLFAGTGAVGIEALSRGASSCTFVERSRAAVNIIRANVTKTHLEDRAVVVRQDVRRFLGGHGAEGPAFGLVFVDPPYESGDPDLGEILSSLDAGWLAPEDWTVVLTRGHKSPQVTVPVHWAARRHLRYGDSLLTLYQEVRWA